MSGRILERVARIHLTWKRLVARNLVPYGVNPKQLFLLRRLSASGGMAPSAIADLLFADRPTVTSMLATLERAGWILRSQDPDDGRRVVIRISAGGLDKLASVPEHLWRSGRTTFDPEGGLEPGEKKELERLLDKLAQYLEGAPS